MKSYPEEIQMGDIDMSEEKPEALDSDWNWEEIYEVWDRIASIHDHLKTVGKDIRWVSKGSLFATMQLMLTEYGGNASFAKIVFSDVIRMSWNFICDSTIKLMKKVHESKVIAGQRLTPTDKAKIKEKIDTLERTSEEEKHNISEEDLVLTLEAQDHLSEEIEESSKTFGGSAVANALIVMIQQYYLFECQGDVLAAKSAVEEALFSFWGVSIQNSQRMVEVASEELAEGPPENRPN